MKQPRGGSSRCAAPAPASSSSFTTPLMRDHPHGFVLGELLPGHSRAPSASSFLGTARRPRRAPSSARHGDANDGATGESSRRRARPPECGRAAAERPRGGTLGFERLYLGGRWRQRAAAALRRRRRAAQEAPTASYFFNIFLPDLPSALSRALGKGAVTAPFLCREQRKALGKVFAECATQSTR
jgi:hypothetical protein